MTFGRGRAAPRGVAQGGVWRALILGALGVLIAGCAYATPAETTPSLTGSNEPPSVSECGSSPLLGPDGRPVFLTGTWSGTGDPNAAPRPSVYYIRQSNECVAWVGLSAEDGEAVGASWIEAFRGRLGSDLMISGLWDQMFGARSSGFLEDGRGEITVELEFVPVADGYEVELRLQDSRGDPHYTKRWVREDTSN